MKDEEWTKRDGSKIMVSDMTEGHAKATLRMLIRNLNKYKYDARQFQGADEGDQFSIY